MEREVSSIVAAEQLVMDDGSRVEVIYPGDVLRFMPYAPDDRT